MNALNDTTKAVSAPAPPAPMGERDRYLATLERIARRSHGSRWAVYRATVKAERISKDPCHGSWSGKRGLSFDEALALCRADASLLMGWIPGRHGLAVEDYDYAGGPEAHEEAARAMGIAGDGWRDFVLQSSSAWKGGHLVVTPLDRKAAEAAHNGHAGKWPCVMGM